MRIARASSINSGDGTGAFELNNHSGDEWRWYFAHAVAPRESAARGRNAAFETVRFPSDNPLASGYTLYIIQGYSCGRRSVGRKEEDTGSRNL